jgi:anti-sigma B factor antagonist
MGRARDGPTSGEAFNLRIRRRYVVELTFRKKDAVLIFNLKGNVIGPDGLKLREAFQKAIDLLGDPVRILVNLEGVGMMDSSALGALVNAYTHIQAKKGRIGIMRASPNIEKLLTLAKLNQLFEKFDSEEDAIAGMKG